MDPVMLIFFMLPMLTSWLLTPLVMRIAPLVGAMDLPNERKVHTRPMPRLGGLAIFLSFFLSMLALSHLMPASQPFRSLEASSALPFVGSLTAVLILGIADDIHPLRPSFKFGFQVVIALCLYLGGFRIASVTGLSNLEPLPLGVLDMPLTILWITGVTNALNLIDGLDGLAAGVGTIAALTIFSISFISGDLVISPLALTLAGALVGFLRYNFNPARIFLGDSGSLFIGVLLAVLSIQSSTKGSTAFAITVPILALGLPLMDTILAMIRRLLHSFLPEAAPLQSARKRISSMFLPDRRHIHHQLLSLGLSQRKAVVVLYIISSMFGIGALLVTVTNNLGASLVLLCIGLASVLGIRQLQYREMRILRNGILLPIYEKPVWNRTVFLGFLDCAAIAISFVMTYFILPPEATPGGGYPGFRTLVPLVCGTHLTLLYVFGLYRATSQIRGVGDFLHILRAVTNTALVGGLVLALLPLSREVVNPGFLILDFYFLLSLITLVRISFPILRYLSRLTNGQHQRVLIYGAGTNGFIIMQTILNTPSLNLTPVGFLDDNHHLQGRRVNGVPVLGSHWNLRSVLRKTPVDQIILSGNDLKSETLHRLHLIAREHNIPVKRPVFWMEDIATAPTGHGSRVVRKESTIHPTFQPQP